MAGIPVVLFLRSEQRADGEVACMEQRTEGRFSETAEGFLLCYKEDAATGMGETETALLLCRDHALLKRSGAVETKMLFLPGERSAVSYCTDFGAVELWLETSYPGHHLTAEGGSDMLRYSLSDRGGTVGDYTLKLHIKKKDEIA